MSETPDHIQPDEEMMLVHLTHLFGECFLDGLIEVAWTDPENNHSLSKAKLFDITDFGEIPDFAAGINRQGSNVYVGAALRKPGTPQNKRASDTDFLALTACYADLDEPGTPFRAKDIYGSTGPTLAVITGVHPHARAQLWWRVEEPVTDPEEARHINKSLAVALNGDETVVNPSRVMRLGGTVAWPVKDGRIAEVTEVQLTGRPDLPKDALLNGIKPELPQLTPLPQTPVSNQPPPKLNLPDFDNLSVDGCIASIRSGRHWHNNMVKLTAHWINRGMSDEEILLAAEGLTLPGYTAEQTRREVAKMLLGGRGKWGIANPSHKIDEQPEPLVRPLVLTDWTGDRYKGKAPDLRWLIEYSLPLGVPVLLAAMGGVGKSFLALDLALHVALPCHTMSFKKRILGGDLAAHGTAVLLTAEDNFETIHRRFNSIDEAEKRVIAGRKLIVVPMPDTGGPRPLIELNGDVPVKTEFFHDLKRQLLEIEDLSLVVIDPLQAFVMADVTSDPAAGQYMWTAFAELCSATGASVIVTHHMRKSGMNAIQTAEDARETIRGSTALVDGARAVYALWKADKERAKFFCDVQGIEYDQNKIIQGAVVKANETANYDIQTYVRAESGLLVDRTREYEGVRPEDYGIADQDQIDEIFDEIERRWSQQDKRKKIEPFSGSPQSPRYLGRYLEHEYDLPAKVAKATVKRWKQDGCLEEEIYDTRNSQFGLAVIKRPRIFQPTPFAEGADHDF